AADSENDGGREPKTPDTIYSAEAQKQFANWKCQQESERAMGKPIVVISREMKIITCPKTDRHAGIGVMGADDMKHNKCSRQNVRSSRKFEPLICNSERGYEQDKQNA